MLSHWPSSPRGLRSLLCSGQAGAEPGVLLKAESGGLGWAFQAGGGQGAGDTPGWSPAAMAPVLPCFLHNPQQRVGLLMTQVLFG